MLQAAAANTEDAQPMPAEESPVPDGGRLEELRWIEAARSGDRVAFGQLYERFAPVVHGVLLARRGRAEVDDLVQDVFVSAWRRIGELRDAKAFAGWLLAIARNAAALKTRRERATISIREDVAANEERVEAEEECERVLAVLRSLPEAYRETLVLRLVEGLSGEQIAARTGMTHGSVRVNLHRGMGLLRDHLRGHNGEEP